MVLSLGLVLSASAKDDSPFQPVAGARSINGSAPGVSAKGSAAARRRRLRSQVGVASWYGGQFQGRKTAAGERFNMNAMTCAHPSLPMGTWLRVTNLRNRKTAFVRVNDRGPITEGRIVDLSFAAARMLGMPGLAKVKLEALREDDSEMAQELMAQVQMPVFGRLLR